jgi:hypothetical protein
MFKIQVYNPVRNCRGKKTEKWKLAQMAKGNIITEKEKETSKLLTL